MRPQHAGKSSLFTPHRWVRAALLSGLLMALPAAAAAADVAPAPATPAAGEVPLAGPKGAAPAKALPCRPIDFADARIEKRGGHFILVVSGSAGYAPAEIGLVPVMYVMLPDYWQIALVGCRADPPGAGTPYTVELSLDGTLGHKGIRLMGASASSQRRLELPGTP